MSNPDAVTSPLSSANNPKKQHPHGFLIVRLFNLVVLILSVILIVWISRDTFREINLLTSPQFMHFHLWVCIFFIADFFVSLAFAEKRRHYFTSHLLFLLLSIPYLNIIDWLGIDLSHNAMYLIRFVPLARGALAIAIVFGYLSSNAISSLLISYISIVVLVGYFGSLIFFQWEHPANPLVTTYWDALWWSCMNIVTVGCNIEPVTAVGKIVAVILPVLGMVVFPLFTVYITNFVQQMVQNAHDGDKK
ncbi:MAG: two pore domain potassium channel family protein [Candidatus Amulumruptor sp.]|nr:two pore domain potassium channel family protein [Candidatus Amulumruptor sp.]